MSAVQHVVCKGGFSAEIVNHVHILSSVFADEELPRLLCNTEKEGNQHCDAAKFRQLHGQCQQGSVQTSVHVAVKIHITQMNQHTLCSSF